MVIAQCSYFPTILHSTKSAMMYDHDDEDYLLNLLTDIYFETTDKNGFNMDMDETLISTRRNIGNMKYINMRIEKKMRFKKSSKSGKSKHRYWNSSSGRPKTKKSKRNRQCL